MPLIEEMLTEARTDSNKTYWGKVFLSKSYSEVPGSDRTLLINEYFKPEKKSAGVPFVGAEEKADREKMMEYFIKYMCERAPQPQDRVRAFLPVMDEKTKQVTWPADVKRNLFLMSYHIAENFEKKQIDEIIKAKEATGKPEDVEQAKKDRELLDKGQLMLVKDPATGQFTKYIRATELKAGDTAVQFLPPPPQEMSTMMQQGFVVPPAQTLQNIAQGAKSPQTVAAPSSYQPTPAANVPDQVSSNDELTKSFQQKRGKAITNQLKKQGMEVLGDVMFDNNGHAMVKVKSGNDTLLVAVDTRLPFDQDLKYNFTFQDGPAAGKSFSVDESKLAQAFTKPDNAKRSAREIYSDADLGKQLGIKSDGYPAQAPQIKPPAPQIGLPQGPLGPGAVPFKLPPGVQPPKPLAAGIEGQGGPLMAGGQGIVQGQLPTGIKAPPMPKAPGGPGEEKMGVGPKLNAKPVLAGIPAGPNVMAQKAKFQQQQEEGQQAFAAGGPPRAPGRVGGFDLALPGGGGKKQGGFMAIPVVANVVGISSALAAGNVLGGSGSAEAPKVAWNMLKGVWIAFSQYLPHIFS